MNNLYNQVFSNSYIRNIIYKNVSEIHRSLNRNAIGYYDSIITTQWMIENNQLPLLIDKLKLFKLDKIKLDITFPLIEYLCKHKQDIELIKYLYNQLHPTNELNLQLFHENLKCGNIQMIDYLLSSISVFDDEIETEIDNCVDSCTIGINEMYQTIIEYNQLELIKYIDSKYSHVNISAMTMDSSCLYANIDIIEYLDVHRSNQVPFSGECLKIATSNNDKPLVEYLIKRGYTLSIKESISIADSNNNFEILKLLKSIDDGNDNGDNRNTSESVPLKIFCGI
ncbi:hypothetical protein DLAC_09546 [Tieghemostelium lacteum]|uniref:Ankyrin repeat-containing protein n=1 Tax=Tieghemostelium lacteum TaxID=361077 RepID=A0A151Z6J8_TIELA|nr:hypothetical protein DLAC_09546 [Tieghemostelium lacteum]|eukprot:KYQ89591.1 hypothetical protein DLAC_09546 [Tieghemostelium lacteum]